jgi:phospholipid/cholesterol/gamma-HCH transport system substrate-binding protein
MTRHRPLTRVVAVAACVVLTASGCAFEGLNSLDLPSTVGRGPEATIYHVEIANVGALESNSPVMVGDVIVGTVGRMRLEGWHADVEVSVRPDAVVAANAVASVGQTSLLGSMHLALNPPVGQKPTGRLAPGAVIGLNSSSTYPSTEQTLSSLSVVVNGGGLGQAGDIIREFSAAVNGREAPIRDLLTRLNDFIGVFDSQRDQIIESIAALDRLSAGFAGQNEVLTAALRRIPPALEVLVKQRPQITTALRELGAFSDTASALIDDAGSDLVRNLENLEPTLRSLADVGPDLGTVLSYAPTYPYTQNFIDRAIRGDYMNQFIVFDFTVPRLKRGLFLGTRWGQEGMSMTPAPGDPWYSTYTLDPLNAPVTPAPPEVADLPPLVDDQAPTPPVAEGN